MPVTKENYYRSQRRTISFSGILMFAVGLATLFMELAPVWGILLISFGAITMGGTFFLRTAPFPIAGFINLLNAILLGAIAFNSSGHEDKAYLYLFAALTFIYLTASIIQWRNWRLMRSN